MARIFDPFDVGIRKLDGYVALGEDDRAAIRALPFKRRSLEPSAYIIREGERPEHCILLLSGFAFRQKLAGDGGRQILSIHIPGDWVDLQNLYLTESDHNIQALTRAETIAVPRAELRALAADRPVVAQAFAASMLAEASILREWLLNAGRRDSRAALAHLLCEFAARLEAQGLARDYGYELPMTQEQLGDALGLTAVHVNRTLKALQAEGLITRDRRRIALPRWKELRDIADFNTRYLHLDQQA